MTSPAITSLRGIAFVISAAILALPLGGLLIAASGGIGSGTSVHHLSVSRLGWATVRTVLQAGLSASTCIVIAVPVASVLFRYQFFGRRAVLGLLLVPFALPSLAVAASVSALFEIGGPPSWLVAMVDDEAWAALVMVVTANTIFNVGLVVHLIGPALRAADENSVMAARTLGSSGLDAWWRVVWPAVAASVRRSFALVFLLCCTNFGVVLVLAGPSFTTIDLEIWYLVTQVADLDAAAVLTVGQSLVLGLVVATVATSRTGSPFVGSAPRRSELTSFRVSNQRQRAMVAAASAASLAVVSVPAIAILERASRDGLGPSGGHSFGQLGRMVTSAPQEFMSLWGASGPGHVWWTSIIRSLGVGICVVVVGALCTPLFVVGRARWIERLLIATLTISPVAFGVGLLAISQVEPFDRLSSETVVTWALVSVALPFGLALIADAARNVSQREVESARLLGEKQLRAIARVSRPIVVPALISALGIAVALAFGDIAVTAFVADGADPTVAIVARRFLSRPQPVAYQIGLTLSLLVGLACALAVSLSEIVSRLAIGSRHRRR